MRKKRLKNLGHYKKPKETTKIRKAKNHLKLFLTKKNTPQWEILIEEYKLLKKIA
jgi:hypothetical protein